MTYYFYDSLDNTVDFCQKIGGQVFVTDTDEKLDTLISLRNSTDTSGYVFTGICSNLQQEWTNVNNGNLIVLNYQRNMTLTYNNTSITGSKCYWYNYEEDALYEGANGGTFQPNCEILNRRSFFLRGLCDDIEADIYFAIESPFLFLGFIYSQIVYSFETNQWELQSIKNNKTIAYYKREGSMEPPIGEHEWCFPYKDCEDSNPEVGAAIPPDDEKICRHTRTLNFHLEVEQPGNFCCKDGTCMDSNLVCDGSPDCQDEEDEENCKDVNVPDFYDSGNPPTKVIYEGRKKVGIRATNMEVNVEILDILSVSQEDSYFKIFYDLNFQWFDEFLEFEFLKPLENGNVIRNMSLIWYPEVKFYHVNDEKVLEKKITVQKNDTATMSTDHTDLDVREIYDGTYNRLKLSLKLRQEIVCSFHNVPQYPFSDEECYLQFFLEGVANTLVNFDPCIIKDSGPSVVNQYNIKEWRIEKSQMAGSGDIIVKVTLLLSRQFSGIFLVTYLPTIMMNVINQATNYIQNENKECAECLSRFKQT